MEKKLMIEWLVRGTVSIPKLLLESYSQLGLNEEEALILIHVHDYIQSGEAFPTPDQLHNRMTLTTEKISSYLRHLIQRGFLKLEQVANQPVFTESYSLEPLWDKLIDHRLLQEKADSQKGNEDALYSIFEKEFGRPLSPIECETLAMWMDQDHHSPNLIVGALREAVISGKLNFRYIDRILFDWQRNGIKSLQEAKAHGERVRGQQKQTKQTSARPKENAQSFSMYNWLEND